MASTKAALKAAKAALDAQKYDEAASEARKVLEADPKHYHANVFLGLALEKSNKMDESEAAYQTAASSKSDDVLVWQGLISLFEKQGGKKLNDYADVVRNVAQIYANADDRHKCQSVVDKYVGFAKQHGSRQQLRQAYDIMTPGSPIYDCLEGRVPKPDFVYMRIAELIEADETERVNRLIAERRTRLGARLGQVTAEVKREVYMSSDLEGLYQGIIDYTHDDELRRQYEEKLLQRAYDVLSILPSKEKATKRQQVQKLAEGMVIIKAPFELAWRIVIEWKDAELMEEWDFLILHQYVELFPDDGLTRVLRGFFRSEICPFPKVELEKAKEPDAPEEVDPDDLSAEDRLALMTEGLEESSKSALSQRIMSEYYLYLEEFTSAVQHARTTLDIIKQDQELAGLEFQNRQDGASVVLATALIQYQSPRHHREANTIFENVISRKPANVSALVGIGMIMEEDEDYSAATEFLSRAWKQNPTIKVRSEAAWCKALAGGHTEALTELEQCLEELNAKDAKDDKDRSLKAELLYRIGQCVWNVNTSKASRKDRNGAYARWLQCIQLNINHAPAYTSLGIFYSDYVKDRKRARKCFQKAFELSPSEVYAAERLARAFADIKDWDLVETVAQRVKDSGRIRPPPGSKKKAISWPYAALGVCHLNNQAFAQAVPEFNAALRVSPGDYHSWVGLGESYHNLGRFVAATRSFEEACKYESSVPESDTWFCKYMLANVHRDLGEFDEAIEAYDQVLGQRPHEFGVSVALLQTYVEQAWHSNTLGLFGRAAQSSQKAIHLAASIVKSKPEAFNLWKALGEACTVYASLGGYSKDIPQKELLATLQSGDDGKVYALLSEIDGVSLSELGEVDANSSIQSHAAFAINAAILAYKRGIAVSAKDIHAQAVSWYNLGWTEYTAHASLAVSTNEKTASRSSKFLKAAVRCFKRAIELEARNAEFWNSLGIVTTPLNARVAQHAFVRSLHLNDKSAQVWTNLGALYLLENDFGLAHEAFTRGQSADPGYAHAWVGQGILALLKGDASEARASFTHAFEISDSSSVITKRLFTTTSFDHILKSTTDIDIAAFLQPLFALQQLRIQQPSDIAVHHLSSLFAERIGIHTDSIEALTTVTETIEAEYEQTEAPETLSRFAQAQADLARACLACGQYEDAAEHATTALDLSAEEDASAHDSEGRNKYRLSARLTAGLAYARQGQADESIVMFRAALTESSGNPDVVCLLAQVLWAKGTAAERGVAREQLLDSVEKHPDHPSSIILLSAIALLDDDNETIEAIAADLQNLRTRSNVNEQDLLRIANLLQAFAVLQPETVAATPELAERLEAASSIMLAPSKPYGWAQMSAIADDPHSAEMAVLTASSAVPPRGTLSAAELAKTQAATHRVADAQRAIMLAPWIVAGWKEFGEGVKALG